MKGHPLTARQADVLFVVSQHGPISVRGVAGHLLATNPAIRSRLDGLERRRLVARRYTGLRPGDRLGWVVTATGMAAVDAIDGET